MMYFINFYIWHCSCLSMDNSGGFAMAATTPTLLLALRSPQSGWLATLITALDEARADPGFDAQQQALFAELAAGAPIAANVRKAAMERQYAFDRSMADELAAALEPADVSAPVRLDLAG